MAKVHWHAIHNVSGYMPEQDEIESFTAWEDAQAALISDLEYARDDDEMGPDELNRNEQIKVAILDVKAAPPGQEFLTYAPTHADGRHDIPTAWQITSCTEDECNSPKD